MTGVGYHLFVAASGAPHRDGELGTGQQLTEFAGTLSSNSKFIVIKACIGPWVRSQG
jgi:hypothetical protein